MLAEQLTNGFLTLTFWGAMLLLGMVGSLAVYVEFRRKLREIQKSDPWELDIPRPTR